MENFYAFYDPATGKIISRSTISPDSGSGSVSEIADARAAALGLLAAASDITLPLQSTYIDLVTKENRPMGERPSKDHTFDYSSGTWLDIRTLAQLKLQLMEAVTAKRWLVENGGITLPNGVSVKTGTADQDRITSVIVNADIAGITSIDFKAESGWVTLQISELRSVAQAIAFHVQACFTAERSHHEAISAIETEVSARNYDISGNWPA